MSLREFRDCTDDQLLPGCTDEARVSAKQNSFKIGANMLWGASGGVDEGVFFHQLVDKLFLVIFVPPLPAAVFPFAFIFRRIRPWAGPWNGTCLVSLRMRRLWLNTGRRWARWRTADGNR